MFMLSIFNEKTTIINKENISNKKIDNKEKKLFYAAQSNFKNSFLVELFQTNKG